jgi:hypothetical protein
MDALPSTEFRKRFARLAKPTVVTVNGHPIGSWHPWRQDIDLNQEVGAALRTFNSQSDYGREVDRRRAHLRGMGFEDPTFNRRPFTPVPKGK